MPDKRKLAQGEIFLASALWGLGIWGAATRNAVLRQYLYFFAWYPYLLFLDGLLLRLQGRSWLWHRGRDFGKMCLWSVTIWLVFEAFNLRLQNWGYVDLTPQVWLRWPGYLLSFATVVPGILLTAEALKALGAWLGATGRPRSLGNWQPAAFLLGAILLMLPLVFPHAAFPLAWVALVFLLDPWVDLLGGPSLLARWAGGERREMLCLMAAGLLCGFWWEMWNYPATSRWVYTLPVLHFGKIFEMPFLGYLGFIPFALEAAVMYNFSKILEERVLTTTPRRRLAWVLQGCFWLVMFAALDAWTVRSYLP